MQQLMRSISAVFVAVILVATMGCAASVPQESTGEYIDDAVITSKVKASILNQPPLKSLEIHVQTFKGTVYLSGFVSSQASIDKAIELARGVPGVKSVKNDMLLK